MAINSLFCFTAFILIALVLWLPFTSGDIPSEELETAISVLRVSGCAIFANALTTSDILFDLLSVESLTLLVPTDAMLYNLDMTYSLPVFISNMRLHALPRRFPLSDLRSLPNASSIPTFVPSHHLLLTKPSSSDSIYIDGVQLLLPGLFYDQHIAVYGLADILPLRSHGSDLENRTLALPPMVDTPDWSPSPSPLPSFGGSRSTWLSQSPEAYINFFGRTPAEPPKALEVSVSPSQLEDDLIIGDGDSITTEF